MALETSPPASGTSAPALDPLFPSASGEASGDRQVGPRREALISRLRRGGILFTVYQFAGMAVGFGSGMVLVRVADQRDVASYMLLLQAIMSVSLILQLGLGPAALRFAPITRGEGGERATALLRRRLFGLQAALWVVAVPLLAVTWPRIALVLDAPELARATPFLTGAALTTSFGFLMDCYLRAFRFYSATAPLSHLVPRLLILGGFVGLWLGHGHDAPWEVLASIYVGALLLTAFGYAVALGATTASETSEPRVASPAPGLREILGASTAMGLRSAASVLYVSSSLWILSWARSHEEVAVYGVAVSLLQVLAAIPAVASLLIPQELSLLFTDGRKDEMEHLARTVATVVAMISVASILGLLLLGRPLIRLAYGAEYGSAWSILLVLALGNFWDSASGGAGYVLQMTGHHVRLLLLTVGGAVLNVVLSLILAPLWGGHGIALATSVTLVAINVAMVRSAKQLVGVRTFVHLRPSQWVRALHTLRARVER